MKRLTRSQLPAKRLIAVLAAAAALAAMVLTGTGSAAPKVSPTIDLKITKTDSPDPVRVGTTLTYTIKVENFGPLEATGVVVTDTLPKGVTFVSASSTIGQCSAQTRKVTCNLGSMPGPTINYGTPPTITIAVIPHQAGTISNTASVKGNEKDRNTASNQATATTRVIGAATCRGVAATITGTPGNDVLAGTGGPDVIVALGGDDQITSSAGRDLICAGAGNDRVASGPAADRVLGGAGKDRLLGRGGPDVLKGQAGGDVLRGGRGSDRLRGGRGFDTCRGGPGANSIRSCER
jgi:uncharacterized repeat protein (TIGR01451 family)